jgi:hypothetical protein
LERCAVRKAREDIMTKIVSVKSESFKIADSIVQRREAAKVAAATKRRASFVRKFRPQSVALGTGAFKPEATPVRVPWLDGLLRD